MLIKGTSIMIKCQSKSSKRKIILLTKHSRSKTQFIFKKRINQPPNSSKITINRLISFKENKIQYLEQNRIKFLIIHVNKHPKVLSKSFQKLLSLRNNSQCLLKKQDRLQTLMLFQIFHIEQKFMEIRIFKTINFFKYRF